MGYTDAQKRAELSRELNLRRRNYPHWVAQGRMSQEEADAHIKIMEAIWSDYVEENRKQKEFKFEAARP